MVHHIAKPIPYILAAPSVLYNFMAHVIRCLVYHKFADKQHFKFSIMMMDLNSKYQHYSTSYVKRRHYWGSCTIQDSRKRHQNVRCMCKWNLWISHYSRSSTAIKITATMTSLLPKVYHVHKQSFICHGWQSHEVRVCTAYSSSEPVTRSVISQCCGLT